MHYLCWTNGSLIVCLNCFIAVVFVAWLRTWLSYHYAIIIINWVRHICRYIHTVCVYIWKYKWVSVCYCTSHPYPIHCFLWSHEISSPLCFGNPISLMSFEKTSLHHLVYGLLWVLCAPSVWVLWHGIPSSLLSLYLSLKGSVKCRTLQNKLSHFVMV